MHPCITGFYSWYQSSYSHFIPVEIDKKNSVEGEKSLKLSLSERIFSKSLCMSVGVPIKMEKNKNYTFSFYAKSTHSRKAFIGFLGLDWKDRKEKMITLTQKWKRYSVNITTKENIYFPLIKFYLDKRMPEDSVWLDCLQIEKGKNITEYKSSETIVPNLIIDNDHVFFKSQIINFSVAARQVIPSHDSANLYFRYKIKDHLNNVIIDSAIPIKFSDNKIFQKQIELKISSLGVFDIEYFIEKDNKPLTDKSYSTFAIVNPPLKLKEKHKAFCGLDHCQTTLKILKKAGVRYLQLSHPWKLIEYKKGVEDWDSMDRLFSEYKQKDFLIKLVFCNGPVWTLEKPASRFLKGFTPKEANNIQTRLLPANLNNWRAFLRNFVSKYHKKIDLYEIGAEYDLFLGDNLYYRKLYPDMINHGLLCKGPVIDLYSEMIKQGEKEILAIDPEAKIGAIRPSNVDCERNFPFSGAVFKKSGKSFNVFPLDPYTYPRRIGPQLPPTRDPEYLNEIFDNAIKMAAQYGQNQSIYVSELAWYHYTIGDFNNEYEKTAIRKMLRSCLLSRTYDQMLHWMWMGSGWYESLGTPLCYWGIYPSPLLPAYSMLAQIVENVSESKELILSQTTKSFVFKKNTSATGAIWSVDNKQKKLSLPYNAKLAILDVMGNPVKIEMHNNIIHIPINGTPVYFSMEGENAFKKILDIISNGKIEESPLKIAFRQTGINKGEILLTNLMSSKLNGEFSISMSKKVLYEKNFSIPKNNKESFEIPLIKSKEKEKINVAIACQGKERINASFPYNLLFSCPQINKTIMIDGKADEEKDHLICFKMDKRKQIMPPDPWINWSGVEDLSGKVFLGWNKKFIYIYAQIIDDKHFNNKLGAKCYDGDALQLAFDFENDATLNEFSGYDKNDIDVIVALTKTGKTSSRLPKGSSYEIIRNEKEKTTCYEIVIPIESFKRNLAVKKVIGFNFVIFDDDDGTGATYYYQFSPGITQNKNPAMFHKIILEE